MRFFIAGYVEDHLVSATAKPAKVAFEKAIEWHVVQKLTDVSIRVGVSRYSIAEFSSMLAVGKLTVISEPSWTAEEEASLRFMGMAGETLTAVSKELNRSECAIRHRLKKLGLGTVKTAKGKLKVSTSPAPRRWTADEENKLDELLDAGKEAAEIGVILNRSRQAVYARLQRLYRKRARLAVSSRILE
jgi:predicted transcriptional regulator